VANTWEQCTGILGVCCKWSNICFKGAVSGKWEISGFLVKSIEFFIEGFPPEYEVVSKSMNKN
jgi:hypothetical protein